MTPPILSANADSIISVNREVATSPNSLMGTSVNSGIIAFWYKKVDMIVMHMDGRNIRVLNIKSESGKKVADVLRTQLYNK